MRGLKGAVGGLDGPWGAVRGRKLADHLHLHGFSCQSVQERLCSCSCSSFLDGFNGSRKCSNLDQPSVTGSACRRVLRDLRSAGLDEHG